MLESGWPKAPAAEIPPKFGIPSFPFRSWLAKTDPKDVARVESRTVIVTENQRDTIPVTAPGVKGQLGNWMNPKTFQEAVDDRFPGCMKGEWDGVGFSNKIPFLKVTNWAPVLRLCQGSTRRGAGFEPRGAIPVQPFHPFP